MDRNEERGGRQGGGERDYDDRYRERYADEGDRERHAGRFGRWDEDRGRDDDRPRYQGYGGQSGSQAGGMSNDRMSWDRSSNDRMSDNMFREQTGYRDRDMYNREPTGYGHGGGRGDDRYGREMQRGSWGTGGQSQGRDYGGTLGRVDHPYRQDQQPGSQWGTSGPFGGGHRGKGPSGYMRSDDRIREDVCDILTDDDHVDATHIEISVKNGEVTLSGTVPDRRSKRMAEDIIERVPGIKDVTNHIRVQDRERESTTGNGGRSQQSPQSVSSSPERDTDNGKRPRA